MPLGKCPLCLRDNQELQDSHYLPKRAYRNFRVEALKNPNPITVIGDVMSQTSLQIHDFVLCWDCEQLLSRNGEEWVIPQLANENGFPLLATLHSAIPTRIDDDLKVYDCAGITGIDCDKLAHFAMGMFWKGHAHKWHGCERLNLGTYGELARKFIRAEGSFPENMALIIMVADMLEPPWFGRLPNLAGRQPFHFFSFYLSGINFCLAVGKGIPIHMRETCFCRNPARQILAALHLGPDEIKRMGMMVQRSRPSQKLTAFLKGPNPRGVRP